VKYVTAHAELLPWTQRDWLAEAHAWIRSRLNEIGAEVKGQIEQHYVRPWATVLRAMTRDGAFYFKANASSQAFEIPLAVALARWHPGRAPAVVAADVGRSWMLMPDGGTRLRDIIGALGDDAHYWERAVAVYAELQMDLADRTRDLLALGVPDLRLASLPSVYEELLTDVDTLRIGLDDGLTAHEYCRLRELAPKFAAMCAELASFPIPETLQHDEIHDGHVFIDGDRYSFFDWGDSSVSHPFNTLRTTFNVVVDVYALTGDDPFLTRLRDAYLEPWTAYGSREILVRAFEVAQRVAAVPRAVTFGNAVGEMESPIREGYVEIVPAILRRFLRGLDPKN
jgi:hypothetical protein